MTEHVNYDTLIDYMHAALSAEKDAQIYAHLESCAECRREYDAELALTDILRAYVAADARELPSSVKAEIWERIRNARPSALRRLGQWFRPAVAVPMAAAIAVAAYFGTIYLGPSGPAPIDAAYYLQDHAAVNSTVPFNDRSNPDATDFQTSSAPAVTFMADANP